MEALRKVRESESLSDPESLATSTSKNKTLSFRRNNIRRYAISENIPIFVTDIRRLFTIDPDDDEFGPDASVALNPV